MAERARLEHKCTIGAAKRYVTEYKWTWNDWCLLYDTTYEYGIHTGEFELNGTDGTCKISVNLKNEQPLSIEFSDTLNILAMKVTFSMENIEHFNCYYSKPISKSYNYAFKQSLRKESPNYICKSENWLDDTLVLAAKIVIVKSVATTRSPNETAITALPEKTNNLSPNILMNFKSMLDKKSLCDVIFVLGDEKFSAHKALLAAQSKVFEEMFVNIMEEEQEEEEINIAHTKAEVFEDFLNYLYTGQVTDLASIVEDIIVVADYYGVSPLKTTCEEFMMKNLSEENVVEYVMIADKCCCVTLKDEALHWLRNSEKLLEKALVEEDLETIKCLKEILANNPEKN